MTSDLGYDITKAPLRAYVFALLKGEEWAPVARVELALTKEGRQEASFTYGGSWLARADAFPLDPINLPLQRGEMRAAPMFGALLDAGPDRWGAHLLTELFHELLDNAAAASKAPRRPPNALDRLFLAGDDRVGALAFGPTLEGPLLRPAISPIRNLADLAEQMAKLDAGEAVEKYIQRLGAGTSLGGARPKATTRDDDGSLWLAKFRRGSDAFGHVRVEHAAMTLAAKAGVDVAETRIMNLGSREALLVRRFDRVLLDSGEMARLPFVSAMSLLGLTETSDEGSYRAIADTMRRAGCPQDLHQLYRRMLVNVSLGNTDDHLRNHGLLFVDGGWRLSPAYDVVPSLDNIGMQAISIGTMGTTADLRNALSEPGRFGLTRDQAKAMATEVVAATCRWQEHFAEHGVPEADIRKLSRAVGQLAPPDAPAISADPQVEYAPEARGINGF